MPYEAKIWSCRRKPREVFTRGMSAESWICETSDVENGALRNGRLASNASRVIRIPSSTTFLGNAKLAPCSPLPLPLVAVPLVVPLVCLELRSCWRRVSVSCLMSAMTWRMSSGNVVQSPLRRRERACSWTKVGQFVEDALRAWRRVSWILLYLISNGISGMKQRKELK